MTLYYAIVFCKNHEPLKFRKVRYPDKLIKYLEERRYDVWYVNLYDRKGVKGHNFVRREYAEKYKK